MFLIPYNSGIRVNVLITIKTNLNVLLSNNIYYYFNSVLIRKHVRMFNKLFTWPKKHPICAVSLSVEIKANGDRKYWPYPVTSLHCCTYQDHVPAITFICSDEHVVHNHWALFCSTVSVIAMGSITLSSIDQFVSEQRPSTVEITNGCSLLIVLSHEETGVLSTKK